MASEPGRIPPFTIRRDPLLRDTLIISSPVAILFGLVLFQFIAYAPVSHSFSLEVRPMDGCDPFCHTPIPAQLSVPAGSTVAGSWTTSDGYPVTFFIEDSHGTLLYSSESASGSFDFVANSPPCNFLAGLLRSQPGEVVNVTGTYSSPAF